MCVCAHNVGGCLEGVCGCDDGDKFRMQIISHTCIFFVGIQIQADAIL